MLERERFYHLTKILTVITVVIFSSYLLMNILIELLNIANGPRFNDFDNYYYSAKRFLNGESLYVGVRSGTRFMYPPLAVVLFLPLTVLPLVYAGVLWVLVSVSILIISSVKLSKEVLKEKDSEVTLMQWSVLILMVVSFSPMMVVIRAGQATGIAVAGLCISHMYLLRTNREENNTSSILASVLIPAIAFLKPYYSPSGSHLLQNQKRLLYASIGGVILLLVSILIFGIEAHIEYLTGILFESGNLVSSSPPSEWNAAIYAPFYALGKMSIFLRVSLIICAIIVTILLTLRGSTPIEVALFGTAIIPMAAPVGVDALTVLIPVYLILFLRYWSNVEVRFMLLLSLLLFQVHPYTIEILAKFGPANIQSISDSTWAVIVDIIPIIQPALWGHIILLILILKLSYTQSEYGFYRNISR